MNTNPKGNAKPTNATGNGNKTGGQAVNNEKKEKEDAKNPTTVAEAVKSSDGKVVEGDGSGEQIGKNGESDQDFDKGERDGLKPDDKGKGDDGQLVLGNDSNLLIDAKDKLVVAKFERQTKISKSSVTFTIKNLYKRWLKDKALIAQGKIDETELRLDAAIQRNEVWSHEQRSDLIHSILYGYYVPAVLVQDTDDGKLWFLDGKQRISTIMSFINGEWALSKNTEDVYGYIIAGCKFKDLTEHMQEEILDETIQFIKMKNMNEHERDKMFVKLNRGSSLARIELTRALHSELIESINDIAELPFFKKEIILSKKARVRFVDQEIILQIAMLFEEGREGIKGFGASQIEEFVVRLKDSGQTISEEMVTKFKNICNYLSEAFKGWEQSDLRKSLKKINVPIIFYVAEQAMKENLQPNLFGDFIRSFLVTNYSVDSDYGKSSQAGSSKKENVILRLHEMSRSFAKFLEIIRNSASEAEGKAIFDEQLAKANGIDTSNRALDEEDGQ